MQSFQNIGNSVSENVMFCVRLLVCIGLFNDYG